MKHFIGSVLLLLILGLSVLTHPKPGYACSCLSPGTVDSELAASDAVFQGTVNSINYDGQGDISVNFTVEKYWKGNVPKQTTVKTGRYSASCGYNFKTGKSYLVYARQSVDLRDLTTGLCSRTTSITTAQKDLKELKNAQIPLDVQKEVNTLADTQLSWIEHIIEWLKGLFS